MYDKMFHTWRSLFQRHGQCQVSSWRWDRREQRRVMGQQVYKRKDNSEISRQGTCTQSWDGSSRQLEGLVRFDKGSLMRQWERGCCPSSRPRPPVKGESSRWGRGPLGKPGRGHRLRPGSTRNFSWWMFDLNSPGRRWVGWCDLWPASAGA